MSLIKLFNDINNYNNPINIYDDFLEYYETLIECDKVQPIFSKTNKYNSQYNYYNKKKINKKNKKWKSSDNLTDKEKIQKIIIQYFNKLSKTNFNNIINDFMNDILKIENNILFDIIATEIINKCINDTQYQQEYIKICKLLWNNTIILKNFINIYNENNIYKYQFKLNNKNIYGPFKSIDELKNDVILKYNFKKVLLKYLKIEFDKKNDYIIEYNECDNIEKKFKIKRKIDGIIEIIILLYNNKEIDETIINNILNSLLREPNEINFELIYNIFKNTNCNNNYYKKNILIFKNKNIFNTRTQYFIDEIYNLVYNNNQKSNKYIYQNKIEINKKNNSKNNSKNNLNNNLNNKKENIIYNIEDHEELFIININKRNKEKIIEILKNNNELDDFLYILLYLYFEKQSNITFIKEIIYLSNVKKSVIENVFNNFIELQDELKQDFINFDKLYIELKNHLLK